MPMKGRFPIRRTLEYLQKGDIIFKSRVKIMTVNYNTHGELSEGARSELTAANPNIIHLSEREAAFAPNATLIVNT